MSESMYLKRCQIQEILPQSEPFLLVDEAEVQDQQVTGWVYVDPSWEVFRGHFKDMPVLPGVYMIESMAQTADVLLLMGKENRGKKPLFSAVQQMRFLRNVYPGDTMKCTAEILCDAGNGMYDLKVAAWVQKEGSTEEQKAATGKITLTMK